jgi:ribosome-associated protein
LVANPIHRAGRSLASVRGQARSYRWVVHAGAVAPIALTGGPVGRRSPGGACTKPCGLPAISGNLHTVPILLLAALGRFVLTDIPASDSTDSLVDVACRACLEKKGENLVVLEVAGMTSLADVFVLCTGNSSRQVKAIAEEVELQVKRAGFTLLGAEGAREAMWVLLDYGDVVIHIFERETRYFYNLERLWGNAPRRPVAVAAADVATGEESRADRESHP